MIDVIFRPLAEPTKLILVGIIIAALAVVAYVAWQNWRRFKAPDPGGIAGAPEVKRHRETFALKVGQFINVAVKLDRRGEYSENGRVVVTGWWDQAWKLKAGDYLILITAPDGSRNTRYEVERCGDRWGDDHFFWAECKFAPRGPAVTKART